MIPNAKINDFERLFDSCVFMRRYLDQASDEALGATYAGNAGIAVATGIRQPKVLSLDGTGDWILYPNDQALDIKTEDFTIEFGINTTDVAAFICGKRNGAGNGWAIKTAAGPDINFQIDDGTEVSGNNTTALSAGYHHVAIVADRSGNATFYIDGSADGTLNISGSAGSLTNITQFTVGVDGDGSSNPLNGQIPFIRFWKNRLLTDAEVSQLAAGEGFGSGDALMGYRNQGLVSYWPLGNVSGSTFADIVGSNNGTGTNLTEADLVPGYNQYRQALDFDGSSEYITISDNDSLDFENGESITLSFWANFDNFTGAPVIYSKDPGGNNGNPNIFFNSSGKPKFTYAASSANPSYVLDDAISANIWIHIAWVHTFGTASAIKGYVNGGLESGSWDTGTGNEASTGGNNADVNIGRRLSTASQYVDGSIQDVMIYNRTLTALEVELLCNRQKRGLKI